MNKREFNGRRRWAPRTVGAKRPLFTEISKTSASTLLSLVTLGFILLHNFAEIFELWGGIILVLCAFSAWFVGNRFATLVGTLLIFLHILGHETIELVDLSNSYSFSFWFQIGCGSAVVLMLGTARVALEIEWLHARIDPLTGVLNRKAFFELFERQASDKTVAGLLIFADLDGLKALNDRSGHRCGDQAIQVFVARVKSAIRKQDIFARIGGDEFAIYVNVKSQKDAESIVRRLDAAVNQNLASVDSLTCSFGSIYLPNGSVAIEPELREADRLMYQAKQTVGSHWASEMWRPSVGSVSENDFFEALKEFEMESDTVSKGRVHGFDHDRTPTRSLAA